MLLDPAPNLDIFGTIPNGCHPLDDTRCHKQWAEELQEKKIAEHEQSFEPEAKL